MRRFESNYRLSPTDYATPETFNPRFRDLDARLHAQEELRAQLEALQKTLVAQAAGRIDDVLLPALEYVQTIQQGGFLTAGIADETSLEFTEGSVSVAVDQTLKAIFRPTPFVAIMRSSTPNDWAVAQALGYDEETGVLSLDIVAVNGGEGPHEDVIFSATSGSLQAQIAYLAEIKAVKDTAVEAAGTATGAAGAAASSAGAAAGSASAASGSAGAAASSATLAGQHKDAAEKWAQSEGQEPGGAGTKSAKEWAGVAQGHAEAAALFNPSSYYTKPEIDSALGGVADQITALDGVAIGDIVRTHAPRSGFLETNGASVSVATYPDLFSLLTAGFAWPAAVMTGTPSSGPGGAVNDRQSVAWTADGSRLAVAIISSPYIAVYDWNDGDPIKLAAPASLPAGSGRAAAWSPNGRYLAVGHETTPYITIYDWDTGSPVKITNPASLPASSVHGLSWSSDGRFLACGHTTTPFVTIYDWNTGSPVKLSNPADLPPGNSQSVAFSPDTTKLVVCSGTSPYMLLYSRSGTTFTKISDPASMPASAARGAAWSSDGRYLAVTGAFGLQIYDWETGSPVAEALQSPPSSVSEENGCAWLGDWLFVGANNTNKPVLLYSMESGTPALLQETVLGASNTTYSVAVRPGGDVLATGIGLSPPGLVLYAIDPAAATVIILPSINTTNPKTYIKAANE